MSTPEAGSMSMLQAAATGAPALSRLNPVTKLLVVVVVALALTFVFDPVTPAVVFVLVLLGGRLFGKLRLRDQLRPLLVFLVAGAAILIANVFFNKENATSPALVYLGPIKVTAPALWAAGSLWLRLMCFALMSLVYFKTTEPQELILSLIHQLHLNYRVAFGTMVGYRMLPTFQADYQIIRAAQRVRGVHEKRGRLHLWSRLRRYAIPLLAGAVRKGGRVALAMDARAFGAFPTRTYRRRLMVRGVDWVFVVVCLAVVAAVFVGLWQAGVTRFTLW